MPSAVRRFFAWNRASAAAVAAVNRPSTAFGSRPYGISLNSSEETSQPTAPTRELALPEQRASERPERRPRLRLDAPGDRDSLDALQVGQARRRERPLDAVDRRGIEPVRLQRDLEGGDAGAPRGTGGTAQRECRRNGGREHEQAAHSPSVGRAPVA